MAEKKYKRRIVDQLLAERLEEVGAVLIEGPKWCGHLITYEAKRYNAGSSPTGDFKARSVSSHIFRVKASSASSTLEIKVTDRFGNVSTESMKRPRAFSIAEYK